MSQGRKGQSSLEFLSMVALSALMLAILHGVMVEKQSAVVEYENTRNAEIVARQTAFQVEMALVQGEGYSRVFSVPEKMAGADYTIEVRDGGSAIEWRNNTAIVSSRYEGDPLYLNSSESNTYRVVNDGDVSLVPQ